MQMEYVKIAMFSTSISLHRVLSKVRPSGVVNRVPHHCGKLVRVIVCSIKRLRLLIAGDGQQSATRHESCL